MPFFPEGYSTVFDRENTVLPIYSHDTLHDSAATMSAMSKAPVPTAPSSLSSLTRSSLANHSDLMPSSPSTSHTSSFGRTTMSTDISPLRPSRAANTKPRNDNVVPNSEPTSPVKSVYEISSESEHEAVHEANSRPQSPAPSASSRRVRDSPVRKGPQAFVEIISPASEKRTTRDTTAEKSKRKRVGDSRAGQETDLMDDAALAAALAREEAMSVRRSARSSRTNVTYSPNCDAEGRPLQPQQESKASTSAKPTKTKKVPKPRSFSDDENDGEATEDEPASKSVAHADKAPPKSRKRVESDDEDEEDSIVVRARTSKRGKNMIAEDETEESRPACQHVDATPTEPAKKTARKKEPAAKKGKTKAAAKAAKAAADEVKEAEADVDSEAEAEPTEAGPVASARSASQKTDQGQKAVPEQESTPKATSRSDQSRFSDPPASVNIKRITDQGGPLSSARSSPIPTGTRSPGPSSFFGKPLTTLLSSGAARRPGLTRKTNIPSLLNHRGAPKPRVAQIASSKRKMQDDDYEYDAAYEAMIAKDTKNSDSEDDAATYAPTDGAADDEAEIHDDVEYD